MLGILKKPSFSVGCHQFLSDCCPKLMKTYNFVQNALNKRQLKDKNEQYCAVRLFILSYWDFLSIFCPNKFTVSQITTSSPKPPEETVVPPDHMSEVDDEAGNNEVEEDWEWDDLENEEKSHDSSEVEDPQVWHEY